MRIVVLILVVFAFQRISGTQISAFYEQIARVKREAAEDGSMCLLSCIEAMEEQLDAVKSARTQRTQFQQSTTASTCQRYDVAQLDALCGAHKEAKQCLDACPDGEMRAVGVNALTPLNFMCLDRFQGIAEFQAFSCIGKGIFADFKKYLPCLDSICEHAEKTCQPVCRKYKTSVDRLTVMQRDMNVRQTLEPPAVTKMVSDACEFIDCFNDCSRPLIVEKCGAGAADLQRDTVKKAFSSITNLLANYGASEEDVLPSACRNLASPVESDLKNSTSKTSTSRRPGTVSSTGNRNSSDQNESSLETNSVVESEAVTSNALMAIGHIMNLVIVSGIVRLLV